MGIFLGIHFDRVIGKFVLPFIGLVIVLSDLAIHVPFDFLERYHGRIVRINLGQVLHDAGELVDLAVGQDPLGEFAIVFRGLVLKQKLAPALVSRLARRNIKFAILDIAGVVEGGRSPFVVEPPKLIDVDAAAGKASAESPAIHASPEASTATQSGVDAGVEGIAGSAGAGSPDNRQVRPPFLYFDHRGNLESRGLVIVILFQVRVAKETLEATHAAKGVHAAAAKASGHATHAARSRLHATATALFAAAHAPLTLHAAHALHHHISHAAHPRPALHPHHPRP